MKIFVHPQGLCESKKVGEGTRIWAYAHVLEGARIGSDCNICDHVFIEGDVTLGDRVTVKSGVQLWDGLRVGDDVFIGPNATFTNDKFPRSKEYPEAFPETRIEDGASIGANATVLPGLRIGKRAMVGAGAVVTHDVPDRAVVIGNPARIQSYVDTKIHDQGASASKAQPTPGAEPLAVQGAVLHRMRSARDLRGSLTVAEAGEVLPFDPVRLFFVYDVPGRHVRGEHAHRECHQFLTCPTGSVHVIVDDGTSREEVVLDHPTLGLHVPPMIWSVQYRYSPGAVLLVLASHSYDPDDYIRDYDEYLSAQQK